MLELDANLHLDARRYNLFPTLKDGTETYVQPRELVGALELAPNIQQDADEFWNMLIANLESMWASDMTVGGFIPEHFRGHLLYETICSKCKVSSRRTEAFYGLPVNIQGKGSLEDGLQQSLETEHLVDSDRYDCNTCGKQDAVRHVTLKRFPPGMCVFPRRVISTTVVHVL